MIVDVQSILSARIWPPHHYAQPRPLDHWQTFVSQCERLLREGRAMMSAPTDSHVLKSCGVQSMKNFALWLVIQGQAHPTNV